MKKGSAIVAGVILAGLAGWLGATWYTGKQIEAHSQRHLATANEKLENLSPLFGLRLEQLSYERGWFSTRARYALSVAERQPYAAELPSEKLEFDTRIEHGPFPKSALARGVFAPRLAYAYTELAKTDDLKPVFDLFNDVPPLTSEDIVSYDGKIQSSARVAPLQLKDDEMSLDFSGVRMNGTFELARQAFTIDALVDTFALSSLDDDPMNLRLSGMSVSANSQLGKFGLGVGDSALRVERIDMNLPDKEVKVFSMDGFVHTAKISENDKGFFIEATYETGNVTVNDVPVGSGRAVFHLDQLDGPALKRLAEAYDKLLTQIASGQETDIDEEALKAASQADLRKLLAGNPTLSIQPMSWKNEQGESQFTAKVSLAEPEDFETLSLNDAAVRAIREVDAKLVLSKPMLRTLVAQHGVVREALTPEDAAAQAQEQVESLAALADMMGFGKDEGDTITSTFVFADGAGELNGNEIPAEAFADLLSSAGDDDEVEDASEHAIAEDAEAAMEPEPATELLNEFDADHLSGLLEERDQSFTVERAAGVPPVMHLDPSSVGADALRIQFLCQSEGEECYDLVYVAEYKTEQPLPLQDINQWNKEYRWTRVYLDDEGVAVLEMDVNAEGGIGSESLRLLHDIFMDIAGDFSAHIAE